MSCPRGGNPLSRIPAADPRLRRGRSLKASAFAAATAGELPAEADPGLLDPRLRRGRSLKAFAFAAATAWIAFPPLIPACGGAVP